MPYSWLKAFTWLFWKLKELLQDYKLSRVEAFMRILRSFPFLYKFHSALDNLQNCKLGKSFIFLSFAKKLLRFCPRTSFYCGISIKPTPFKANTSLRRTVVLYMDGFTVKLLQNISITKHLYKGTVKKWTPFPCTKWKFSQKNIL